MKKKQTQKFSEFSGQYPLTCRASAGGLMAATVGGIMMATPIWGIGAGVAGAFVMMFCVERCINKVMDQYKPH